MKSKTLSIIKNQIKIIKEQDEQDPNAAPQPEDATVPPTSTPEPAPELPFTSEVENDYIAAIIDAALFEPNSEQKMTLSNFQSMMDLKKFKNARDEILPSIIGIIWPESSSKDIRNDLLSMSKNKF